MFRGVIDPRGLGPAKEYGRCARPLNERCVGHWWAILPIHSSYIWVWKSEAVVYSLILLVTLGVSSPRHLVRGSHLNSPCVEDGAVGWSCKCSSGRHCRRIGGHRSRDRARPSCSLSRGHNLRLASPGPRIQAARGLEFCVLGIVVHLRLGLGYRQGCIHALRPGPYRLGQPQVAWLNDEEDGRVNWVHLSTRLLVASMSARLAQGL